MQMQKTGGLFDMNLGMITVFAVLAGAIQLAKYSMLASSISWIPAIISGTTMTIPDGIGIIMAITIDVLQKAMWSGINWSNGLNRKEWLFLTLAIGLLVAEFMGLAAPIIVPDALSMPTGDIPEVFWARLIDNLFGAGFLYAISGVFLTLALAALPELLLEEAAKTLGEKTAWFLFFMGMAFMHVVFSVVNGTPVIPSITWF